MNKDLQPPIERSKNPIFSDLLTISSEIRKLLQNKRNKKFVKCGFLTTLVVFIFLYQFLYLVHNCFVEVYSYYQCVIVSLYLIDLYMETVVIKIIIQYINIFKWEKSENNEEKYQQLKNNKVRQMIYKLVSNNPSNQILPLTMIHHRKMVIGAFVLVFFTQFYFTTNYNDFECFFNYEPIVMNALFWSIYIIMICVKPFNYLCCCCLIKKSVRKGNYESQFILQNSQFSHMSVEQLEQEWKLRSTQEKVVYWKKQIKSNEKQDIENQNNNQINNQIKETQQIGRGTTKCDEIIPFQSTNSNISITQNNKPQSEQTSQTQMDNILNNKIENNNINKIDVINEDPNFLSIDNQKQVSSIQIPSNTNYNQNSCNNTNQIICLNQNQISCNNINQGQQIVLDIQQQQKQQQDELIIDQQVNNTQEQYNPEQEACQICLIELQDGELGRQMKCCKKIFHRDCCLQWFDNKETCPNCRALPQIQFA